MIWECQISSVTRDNRGNDKIKKDNYLVENWNTFSQVEDLLIEEFGLLAGFEVCSIKISKLKEIVNKKQDENAKIYFATIVDRFYNQEKDETTETKYTVALFARDITEAHGIIREYMKQGFDDMELVGLKCTKYIDLLK